MQYHTKVYEMKSLLPAKASKFRIVRALRWHGSSVLEGFIRGIAQKLVVLHKANRKGSDNASNFTG